MDPDIQYPQPLESNSRQNSAWLGPVHETQRSSRTSWLSPLRDMPVDRFSVNMSLPNLNDNPMDRIASNLFSERANDTSDNVELSTSAGYQNQDILTLNQNHTWPHESQQFHITELSQQTLGTWPQHYYNHGEPPKTNMERNAGERLNRSIGPEATGATTLLGSYTTHPTY